MENIEWVSPVIQLATAGGFGALVWYLVIKHIPNIEARHQGERIEWLEYIKQRDSEFSSLTRECLGTLGELRHEIQTVRDKIDDLRG